MGGVRAYCYTENEQLTGFVMGSFVCSVDDELAEFHIMSSDEVSRIIGVVSDKECSSVASEENPIQVSVRSGLLSAYLSFVILVNERNCRGRHKVVFGCTDAILVTDRLPRYAKALVKGVSQFLGKFGLTGRASWEVKFHECIKGAVAERVKY